MSRYRLVDPSAVLVQMQELTRIVYQQGIGEEISQERAEAIVAEAFTDWWPCYVQHVLSCVAGMDVQPVPPGMDEEEGDEE